MKTENLTYFLTLIFAYFAKNPPSERSTFYSLAAHEFVDGGPHSIPDEAITDIASAFAQYDFFPQNLIKAIINELELWKARHPTIRAKVPCCELCASHPGYVYLHREGEYKTYLAKCSCCQNSKEFLNLPVATNDFLQKSGFKLGPARPQADSTRFQDYTRERLNQIITEVTTNMGNH